MNIPRIAKSLEYLDDSLLCSALEKREKLYSNRWGKYIACAASVLIVITMGVIAIMQVSNDNITDNEPYIGLSLQNAYEYTPLGDYLPKEIIPSYSLEKEVGVYDGKVMTANFYDKTNGNGILVQIAERDYFGEVELNTVLTEGKNSIIYIDGGNYIICYSSAQIDLSQLAGLDDMILSATYFEKPD